MKIWQVQVKNVHIWHFGEYCKIIDIYIKCPAMLRYVDDCLDIRRNNFLHLFVYDYYSALNV